MADQSVSVSNMPEPGGKQRVAYDLMRMISFKEETPTAEKAREYYLELFSECRKRVY